MFALCVAVLVAVPALVTGMPAASAGADADADGPRVLTYNTMLLPLSDWDNVQRAQRIGDAAYMRGYDVIVLEELFDNTAANALLDGLKKRGYPYQTPVIGRNASGWDEPHHSQAALSNGGVAIVSSHPMSWKAEAEYKDGCGYENDSAKGFAYARIDIGGRTVHVFGTHTQSDSGAGGGLAKGCADADAPRRVRRLQFAQLDEYISAHERSGAIQPQDMVVMAGDMNVDRYAPEYGDMLHLLHAVPPDASLGWQHSFDPAANTISKYRDGEKAGKSNTVSPPQDLDHVLLREGHARPAVWNTRVLTGTYPWQMVSAWGRPYAFTDYSDHYPMAAGPDVTEQAGFHRITVDKVTLTKVGEDACASVPSMDAYGSITERGSAGDLTLWSAPRDEKQVKAAGDTFALADGSVSSAHGFAIQVDVMDRDTFWCGGPDDNGPLGTVWWNNENGPGTYSATLAGPDTDSEIRVDYTVS